MQLVEFLMNFGNRILSTFSTIITWMQTHGIYYPTGINQPSDWISIFDAMTSIGVPIILGLIIAKWIIDFIK